MKIGVWIYLRKGFSTIIDRESFDMLWSLDKTFKLGLNQASKGKTYNRVYYIPKRKFKKKAVLLHRFILGITDRNIKIDHIDNNPLNNLKSNLRECNLSENSFNRIKNNSSQGLKSVFYKKKEKVYVFEIQDYGKKFRSKKYYSKKMCYLDMQEMTRQMRGNFYSSTTLGKYELEKVTPKKATKSKGSKTKYVGVFYSQNKTTSSFRVQYKNKSIKLISKFGFKDQISAARYYDSLVFKHEGYNGLFNFPGEFTVFL